MNYTHLSQHERYQIQTLHDGGFSQHEIGEALDRPSSTICRELARNAGRDGYEAKAAHRKSTQRRHAASTQPRIDEEHWRAIEARIVEGWSPDQIAGHEDFTVCHERIYQRIAADRQKGGLLWTHLRGRKRRRHRCGTPRQRQRFRGRPISERPAIVESRQRVGDWEGDTIVGKGLARVVTLVERKSGLLRIRRVANGEANTVLRAIVQALHPVRVRVHTLTWDNAASSPSMRSSTLHWRPRATSPSRTHRGNGAATKTPYGLLRQYLPKRCDLSTFSDTQLQHIEDKLNQRPRKRLGYCTPQRVFDASFKRAAPRK